MNDSAGYRARSPSAIRAIACGSVAVTLVAWALGLGGCGGDDIPAAKPPEPLLLRPRDAEVLLMPGKASQVAFLLTTKGGVPVGGERLDFSAIDDPETPTSEVAGATLSAPSSVTDADGVGAVTITGGLPTLFRLAAKQSRANVAEALIIVTRSAGGTIAVVASPVTGSHAAGVIATVDVLMFDLAFCRSLSAIQPPQPTREKRTVALGDAAEFDVAGMQPTAIIGQARDTGGRLRAVGCIDVPGDAVVAGSTVRAYLPLLDFDPVPRGTFVVSSRFSLAKRELLRRMALPWQDLGDCPLDPGQIWLDCAIDALGSPAGDSLDCMPSVNEGDLANLIVARRGSATAGSSCRAATLVGGAQSLDAKVAALFPSPAQAPAADIGTLGTIIGTMLDDFTITSTLAMEPSAVPGMFQATHTLRSATLQLGPQAANVDLVALGLPNSQVRFVPITTDGDVLSVGAHGLGLRLGTLSHAAFAKVALVGRGLPAATAGYLDVLYALATSGTGAARKGGCDALDGLVCGEVGRAAGCLLAACAAGQAALASRLDAAFALADGDGDDLQLSGSALMTDDNADGIADRLGATSQGAGLWTAQIRASAGTETVSASWTGFPQAP
ncbi:MAG: hypothetical protein ABUL77_05055 [Bacteroidota bacterium]